MLFIDDDRMQFRLTQAHFAEFRKRDGLQLLREAVAAGCRIPIVFLTADGSAQVDNAAMHAGALD